MEKVKLMDLIGKNVKGIKANVIRQGGKYHYDYQDMPMIRSLVNIITKKIQGEIWLYWYWIPEQTADGRIDCGYSGIADSENHPIEQCYISIEGTIKSPLFTNP